LAVFEVGIGLGVIALRRRAEGPLYGGVVIEKREKDGNSLNDRGPQFWFNAPPVMIEPAFDCFELFLFILWNGLLALHIFRFSLNGLVLQYRGKAGGKNGSEAFRFFIEPKLERL